ncbi:alkane 1-monooxygenase [Flavobacteriaceae bacterium]|nr:alkane 1-monooxygenase [Flavobacteriaceae bacterium]MDA7724735.1 alkane 1-monooxygenase [Flavobacteriaceae bacterium]MDA7728100.1 alkane 1-monooxygenase [Flavobacteriaceae bacterium]MDA7849268.1 alkane 1-monooxygenase [Flavobacteriaceae bacterium]
MRDLKYLFAYTVPLSAFISFESMGLGTYTSVIYAFIALPFLDLIIGNHTENLSKDEKDNIASKWVFDAMLYLNLPIVFSLLYLVFTKIETQEYAVYELIGLGLSAGILLATNAINVAHELGHRTPYFERFMSKCLYMPCLYMHFYIEHNFGHHMNVATPNDGATAKYNQTVFSFWVTSVTRQYADAWIRQIKLLKTEKRPFLSVKNDMLWYHLIQPTYIFGVFYFFSINAMLFAIAIGVVSFLFLESINYIEHYGLRRFKTSSGRYERVQPHHSWNSNFNIGRIVLYELTRHSDHHFKSSKKYQLLNSYDQSPTLPFGYPASILLSLVPPLWFKIMNPLVPKEMKEK